MNDSIAPSRLRDGGALRKFFFRKSLFFLFIVLVTSGCLSRGTFTPTREKDFKLDNLLINTSIFPSNWNQDGSKMEANYEDKPSGVIDDLYVRFTGPNATATHGVYRFQDDKWAEKGYSYSWFFNAGRVSPWVSPDWMTFQSSSLEKFRFACADFSGGYPVTASKVCISIGQYKEYISFFLLGMSPPENMELNAQLVENILQEIDERMMTYLLGDS